MPMICRKLLRQRNWLCLLCLCLCGCAEGPFNGGGTLNPWLRKEWAKDEARGPTFHTKMNQLRSTASQAHRLPAEQQESLATQLSEQYRTEGNTVLRAAIVSALGGLRSANVDDTLALAIKDNETEVRLAAAKALGNRGNESALQILSGAMSTESQVDVRMALADSLGRFKNSPEATRALGLALNDNDAALQYRAIQSLETVTGRRYGVNVPAWREYLAGGNPPTYTPSLAETVKGWSWW
jgi:HEAT repeats